MTRAWFTTLVCICVTASAVLSIPTRLTPTVAQDPDLSRGRTLVQSVAVSNRTIETKAFLDQGWELRGRAGLTANSGLAWDSASREWRLKSKMSGEDLKGIAHYASWTATPARSGLNIAQAYSEVARFDELAKFYSAFLATYFKTLGELRSVNAPEVKQKLLGPESAANSARTLPWYWGQPDGSVILRECNQCSAEYFLPASRLIHSIATLKPAARTAAMNQFVAAYVPLLTTEHIIPLNLVDRMRSAMNPSSPGYKKLIMIADEMMDVAAAAELLGARSRDPKFVAIGDAEAAKLEEVVRVGVARFQFSQTLTKDAAGRTCASYFNGDYDGSEDYDYARYIGETSPTPMQKAPSKGASWDISHFSLIPMFLWSLFNNRQATGVNFPQQQDIDAIANQYAFHVFEGDYKKPLFTNFFDSSDGWYRVSYSGRSNYGIAPSRFCNISDPSHSCIMIGGIYSWGLLAALNPDIARLQTALVDLARSNDPAIACFQTQCFRERYYRYADSSFSFLDPGGQIQYPPALVVILSELALSFSGSSS